MLQVQGFEAMVRIQRFGAQRPFEVLRAQFLGVFECMRVSLWHACGTLDATWRPLRPSCALLRMAKFSRKIRHMAGQRRTLTHATIRISMDAGYSSRLHGQMV